MERLREGRDLLARRRLDLALLVTIVGMAALTAVLIADPSFGFAFADRSLDVTANWLLLVAGLSLAALAMARYRESGRPAGLFQSSAFLVIAWVASVNIALVVLFGADADFFLSPGGPVDQPQVPFYVFGLAGVAAGLLLLLGGFAAIGGVRQIPRIRDVLFWPLAILSMAAVLLYLLRDFLPLFVAVEGVQQMVTDLPRITTRVVQGVSPLAVILHGAAAGILLAGAYLYRRSYLHDGPVLDGYLAVALVLGAFGEIHFLLYPGIYTGLATTSDLIWLTFFGVLLLGIAAESRSDLRALRSAYAALERLRESEAERAALEERTRLARELHDGLAQDLWFAKLKHERLLASMPDKQRPLAQEVNQALDAAIAEARQAVVTMRASLDRERPLEDLLAEAVEEFGSRSGVRADFSAADLPVSLSPRTQAEVMRVLQEALTNVSKHADATVVRVSAEVTDGKLVLSVVDNGRGFRPDEVSGDGLGVQGMRERARLMGGELSVNSEPSSGTGVHLTVPMVESSRA